MSNQRHMGAGEINPIDDFDFDSCIDTGAAVFKDGEHLDDGIPLPWADLICYFARNIDAILEAHGVSRKGWWVEHDHQRRRLYLVAEWGWPGQNEDFQASYVWNEVDASAPDHMRMLAVKGVKFVEDAIRRRNEKD